MGGYVYYYSILKEEQASRDVLKAFKFDLIMSKCMIWCEYKICKGFAKIVQ